MVGENPSQKPNQKSRFWRFVRIFLMITAVTFVLLWGLNEYQKYEGRRQVDKLAKALKQAQEEDYARAMADTYGGKTPQETLRMYIEAVEAGNYELASKYFILDKQEGEFSKLTTSPVANTENVINILKTSLNSEGSFSAEKDRYVIDTPVLIDFKLYPNGIWKIIEI